MPECAVSPLIIRMFGPFEMFLDGAPLSGVRSRRGQWLLALLALRSGSGVERSWLAGTLWPESPEIQALSSLRSCLAELRRALGTEADRLHAPNPHTLSFDFTGAEVDVLLFDAALAGGDSPSLEQAVALYRGPLLEGCSEEWAFQGRQDREQAYLGALETLAAQALAAGNPISAERRLCQAIVLDPLRESARRALMRAQAASGNYAAAVQTYRELRLLLYREMKVEPDAETTALFQQIQETVRQRTRAHRSVLSVPIRERMPPNERGHRGGEVTLADLLGNERRPMLPGERPGPARWSPDDGPGPPLRRGSGEWADAPFGAPPLRRSRFRPSRQRALDDPVRPLKSLATRPSTLPVPPTPLIGREKELAAAKEFLQCPEVRLLTFTGPAGTGKTRLSLQVAAELPDAFTDGVFFVALAPIHNPGLVASTIARVLEIHESGDRSLLERLKEYLREKQLLLLLDNFEQVLAAAPLVAELLAAAPRLKVLVTSRAVLHLRGEKRFPVPTLAVPTVSGLGSRASGEPATSDPEDPGPETLAAYPSVRLFVDRAVDVQPEFSLTRENALAVAAICHRLDGLPLAIELAAARTKLLPPPELLARLSGTGSGFASLQLLTGGACDLPVRQQTLRQAIAWSYELLDEREKQLFRRLSVFVGGCALEAAEAVCAGAMDEVLDGIASLVDKSLLRQEAVAGPGLDGAPSASDAHGTRGGEVRLWMLETIREYGQEQLEASEEVKAVRAQHARYCLTLAEQQVQGEKDGWLDRLEREHDNLRAALEWYGGHATRCATEEAFRLGTAVWRFWYLRGHWVEGRERLEALLALPGALPQARASLLRRAGQLAWLQGEHPAARSLLEESLALFREVGDPVKLAGSLNALAEVARTQGDYETAQALFAESLTLLRAQGYKAGIAWSLQALGEVAQEQGDFAAHSLMEESLALFREVDDKRGIAFSLRGLGYVARDQGEYGAARALLEECLALFRELGDKRGIARSLGSLGNVASDQGEYGTARALLEECLAIYRGLGDKRGIVKDLEGLAAVAVAQGQPERAARLFGAAQALREAIGAPLPPAERAEHECHLAAARAALGEGAFTIAWMAGRAMSLDQAIEIALQGQ